MSKETIRKKISELPLVKRARILTEAILTRRRPILEFLEYSINKRAKIIASLLTGEEEKKE